MLRTPHRAAIREAECVEREIRTCEWKFTAYNTKITIANTKRCAVSLAECEFAGYPLCDPDGTPYPVSSLGSCLVMSPSPTRTQKTPRNHLLANRKTPNHFVSAATGSSFCETFVAKYKEISGCKTGTIKNKVSVSRIVSE